MQPIRSIAWKETRETLIYLWIGLFVFLALPIIQLLESTLQFSKRYSVQTSGFVVWCGGILAVFIAVGSTCRDLSPKLIDFWQSRPVSPRRWMLIKFIVGLAVLQLACGVPLLVERLVAADRSATEKAFVVLLLFTAIYGLSFLAGILLRRSAHAAMLGLGSMILLWFLPGILPPLSWLDVTATWRSQTMGWPEVHVAISTLALSLAALLLALIAIDQDWQVEAGRKGMYAALGGAALVLFGSLALKLQTNMPELQVVPLDPLENTFDLSWNGDSGKLYVQGSFFDQNAAIRQLQFINGRLGIGPAKPLYVPRYLDAATPASRPDICYESFKPDLPPDSPLDLDQIDSQLNIVSLNDGQQRKVATLWKTPHDRTTTHELIYQQTLYVFDEARLAMFDISDPVNPTEISRQEFHFAFLKSRLHGGLPREEVPLLQLPGVPARARLELTFNGLWWRTAFEGELACVQGENDHVLAAYRLTALSDTTAVFERFAQRTSGVIESAFGHASAWNLRLCNGLLYTSNSRYGVVPLNPSISVFDPNDGFKMVGHFAAPGAGVVQPLPDGRAIVAGSSVYLIGPPPKH